MWLNGCLTSYGNNSEKKIKEKGDGRNSLMLEWFHGNPRGATYYIVKLIWALYVLVSSAPPHVGLKGPGLCCPDGE